MQAVFDAETEIKFLEVLEDYKMEKYMQTYNDFKLHISNLRQEAASMNFSIDFIDDDGLSPLHLSC